MTPNQLHDLLDDFAATEIPDTMNLLKDIEARIKTAPSLPAARPILRFSRAAAVLAVLMIATVAYAVYQAQFVGGDPGITAVGAQELGIPLDLTQHLPDADVNVNLQWAYADGNRIAIAWEVEYSVLHNPDVTDFTVLDADGQPLKYADFLRGGGGGGGGGGDRAAFGSTYSWDATHITDTPESLELTVIMTVDAQENIDRAGGGGGEGGGSSQTPVPTIPFAAYEARFEISVPFIPVAIGATDPITVEAADIPITISDVRYAPSATIGLVCLPVGWYPDYTLRLEVSGPIVNFSTEETPDVSDDGLTECYDFTILGLLIDEDGVLRFSFDRLSTVMPDMSEERFAAFLAAVEAEGFKGVTIDRSEYGGYSVGMGGAEGENTLSGNEIYERIFDLEQELLHEKTVGPWAFEVTLD